MSKYKTITFFIILSLLSSLLISAAPADLVRLTIQNKSNDLVTLRMEGPQFYYLTVRAGETRVFTPQRGEYSAKLYTCGLFVNQELDLSTSQTIVVPACGTKAFTSDNTGAIDAGQLIKIVRVHFTNKTDKNLVLILRGPGEYVFYIRKGETKTYTIPKGDYKAQQYGCPTVKEFNYYASAHLETNLICEPYK